MKVKELVRKQPKTCELHTYILLKMKIRRVKLIKSSSPSLYLVPSLPVSMMPRHLKEKGTQRKLSLHSYVEGSVKNPQSCSSVKSTLIAPSAKSLMVI